MARIRSMHPDACKSEKLSAATDGAERCYWRLLPHCDDEGRCEDNPQLLKAYMFPIRDAVRARHVDSWLTELAGLGLLVRYRADDGRAYLQVTRWKVYQKPRRPLPSNIPAPRPRDLHIPDNGGTATDIVGTRTGNVAPEVGVGVGVGGEMEEKGEGYGEGEPSISSNGEAGRVVPLNERALQLNRRFGDSA